MMNNSPDMPAPPPVSPPPTTPIINPDMPAPSPVSPPPTTPMVNPDMPAPSPVSPPPITPMVNPDMPAPLPGGPPPFAPMVRPDAPAPKAAPRVYSLKERLIVPAALIIAILFDRLIFENIFEADMPFFSGIFWLAYLVVLYAVYWKHLARNKVLWIVGGLSAALCVWNFIFDYDSNYGVLTFLVIPAVLMAHAQFLARGYKLKEISKLVFAWLSGWFYRPFSGIPMLFGAIGSMVSGGKNKTAKKVVIGILITLPLLLVIIPLLCGADRVFGYYLKNLLNGFDVLSFVGHLFVIAAAMMFFYSFIWNIGFAKDKKSEAAKKTVQIDLIISCVVLGIVSCVYLLFCTVQFTYLFAGAGLPGNMTYSEYAREGFAQMTVICAINLLIFGVFLNYGRKHRVITVLLSALLGLTSVMLISGFARLRLYIATYGLTWLRLLSAWFIIYLALVLIACVVRMIKEKLPLIAVCAIMLLSWYVVLGYSNPDALVVRYNINHSEDAAAWLVKNESYMRYASDNGMLVLYESDLEPETIEYYMANRYKPDRGYSFSSHRVRQLANGYEMP